MARRGAPLWFGIDAGPLCPGKPYEDWQLDDPAGDPACRLAEPRLSGFAGQATLAWVTF
jgi:hypothetical protein